MANNSLPSVGSSHNADILYAPLVVTATSPADLKNAAFAVIKREIARLQAERATLRVSIRALCTHHNSLIEIARLPSELLLKVFKLLVEDHTSQHNQMHGKVKGPHWIRITHVCSSWRQIALEYPSLWTHISFNDECYLKCYKEFIFRSKALPLSVQADYFGRDLSEMPLEIRDALHGIMHRVQDLSVYLSNSDDDESRVRRRPWPIAILLKKLMVNGKEHDEKNFEYNPYCDYSSLGETFLDGRAPQLRWLYLSDYNLPLNYSLPISLTTFHVHHSPHPIPVSEMINLLQTIPNLQSLVLAMESCECSNQSPLHHVDLPQLRKLQIFESYDICIALLTRLTIPPTAFRTIEIISGFNDTDIFDFGEELVDDMIGNLSKQLARNMEPIRCIRIERYRDLDPKRFMVSPKSIRLEAWGCPGPDQEPPLIAIPMDEMDFPSMGWIVNICHKLPIQELESLYAINMDNSLTAAMWRRVFGTLPMLRTIQFDSFPGNDFIKALNMPSTTTGLRGIAQLPGQGGVAPPSFSFGALRKLVAVGWDLRERTNSDGKSSLLDLFVECMGYRQRRGVELEEFRIVGSSQFSASSLERLRRVVRHVHVDGI